MTLSAIWRATWLGGLSWAAPLAVSFAFFDRSGGLTIPQPLFKSLMAVAFGGFGVYLLTLAFARIKPRKSTGLALGLYWLALNLGLDFAVLVPMTGMTPAAYFQDIGLRYLLIPAIALGMGTVAERT